MSRGTPRCPTGPNEGNLILKEKRASRVGGDGEAAFRVRLSANRHLYFSYISAFPFQRVTTRRDDSRT